MGLDTQASPGSVRSLGLAVADQLRELYPFHTGKQVARALSCTAKCAENILEGHLSTRTATMIIEAFGPMFMAQAVFAAARTTLEREIIEAAETARQERKAAGERWRQQARLVGELRGLSSVGASVDRPPV